MCGIAGIIHFDGKPVEQSDLKKMTDAIAHRGPDGEGFFIDGGVGFGHRRLAIIDLSPTGAQPMTRFGLTITYNGEIYNYIELQAELVKLGYQFLSSSDTEVILAAYHAWGANCVQRFNGMWAFAIYDAAKQEVFLSRDRFGEKPLYYASLSDRMFFSSEIKGILACSTTVQPDFIALASFMVFEQAEFNERTFFKGIIKVPAGHNAYVALSDRRVSCHCYFKISDWSCGEAKVEKDDLSEALLAALQSSVSLRLRSDVPVSSCLSGGIDSSSIFFFAQQATANRSSMAAITGYAEGTSNQDLSSAKLINDWLGIQSRYTAYIPATETRERYEAVILAQEEPFISTSILLQHAVMETASAHKLSVLLDGQGADELMFGYLPQIVRHYKLRDLTNFMRMLRNNSLTPVMWMAVRFYHSNTSLKRRLQYLTKSTNREWAALAFEECIDSIPKQDDMYAWRLFELTRSSLPALLRYEDKNAMAFGIETRLPYLDPQVMKLLLAQPPGKFFVDGWTKFPLRKCMDRHLPTAVVWRNGKMAFEGPHFVADATVRSTIKKSGILRTLKMEKPLLLGRTSWRQWVVAKWEQTFF